MKVYQDLYISAPRNVLEAVITDFERHVSQGWHRDVEVEQTLLVRQVPLYCFRCTDAEMRFASSLWLAWKDADNLYVSNIVPEHKGQLDYDEYNAVLEDFYRHVVQPAIDDNTAVTATLTPPDVDLDTWMKRRTADLLRRFARSANKSTGTSHPSDKECWEAFLVAAHQEGTSFSPSTLRRWLLESENWPESTAAEIAIEYETGRSLLSYYDRARSSAGS